MCAATPYVIDDRTGTNRLAKLPVNASLGYCRKNHEDGHTGIVTKPMHPHTYEIGKDEKKKKNGETTAAWHTFQVGRVMRVGVS